MRVVIQRCKKASVEVHKQIVGQIGQGIMVLVGFTEGDTHEEIDYIVDKIVNLRIFDDENNVMNLSLLQVKGSILSVSQFTLYADSKKGRRPSYVKALNGKEANKLYEQFNQKLKSYQVPVETGIFGADMQVSLINDGPVTIILEKENDSNGK